MLIIDTLKNIFLFCTLCTFVGYVLALFINFEIVFDAVCFEEFPFCFLKMEIFNK